MADSPHILVVDDDPEVLRLTKRFLSQFNFRVTTADNAESAYHAIGEWSIDCVVLDVMLPGEDGFSVLKSLRSRGNMPVIMLTAMRDDADRIVGLELGADDYVSKPFNPRELMARIRAVLRRVRVFGSPSEAMDPSRVVCFEGYRFNLRARELSTDDGKSISLTDNEYTILSVFIRFHGKTLSRDQLADFVHHSENDPLGRKIDLLVSRLRHKIEADIGNPRIIQTVWRKGYRFSAQVIETDR